MALNHTSATVVIKNGPSEKKLNQAAEALAAVNELKEKYANAAQNSKGPIMMADIDNDYCGTILMQALVRFTARGRVFDLHLRSQAESIDVIGNCFVVKFGYQTGILARKLRTVTGVTCTLEPNTNYSFSVFYDPEAGIGHATIVAC